MNTAPHHDLAAFTPVIQDDLNAIHHLRDEELPVMPQHLVEALDVSNPSITRTVKRLHELGQARHSADYQAACPPQSHIQELPSWITS